MSSSHNLSRTPVPIRNAILTVALLVTEWESGSVASESSSRPLTSFAQRGAANCNHEISRKIDWLMLETWLNNIAQPVVAM